MSHPLTCSLDPAMIRPSSRPVARSPRLPAASKEVALRYIPTTEETNTIRALQVRDREAMDHLVRDQCHRIYAAIFRLVRDPDEARSLVQETFLQAFRSLGSFRGHAKVSTWLYGIAMNVTSSYLRKKKRHRRVLSEQDIDLLQPSFTRSGAHAERYVTWNPERLMEKRERKHLVREAIDQLPEPYRVVLVMRDLEELSTTEVAAALSISEGNVRIRLHRARNAVRKLLAPQRDVL
jgi:RNA polymerase sigma-70 factor (ECF subfamily)